MKRETSKLEALEKRAKEKRKAMGKTKKPNRL
jgi:hypothetical protein